MFYVCLCNEVFESEANGFACNINDIIDITDEIDQIYRKATDQDISPVASLKKDQRNCHFLKRNQCKKDFRLD